MNDLLGLWFGFIGIVVGAVITFITEMLMRKGQMRYDMSKEVRKTLIELNDKLINAQTLVLHTYDMCDRVDHDGNIMKLKSFHWEIMEAYKTFRIHLGDLKAYELDSAIYNYYYEMAFHKKDASKKLSFDDYTYGYKALKNAVGMMINAVRFELVKINQLKKMRKHDLYHMKQEYLRYVDDIISWLNIVEHKDMILGFVFDKTNHDPIYKATETVIKRISPCRDEVFQVERGSSFPKSFA